MPSLRRTFGVALCLLLFSTLSSSSEANFIGEAACKLVDCGQGVCNGSADDRPPFFFRCECYPGWSQFKFLNLVELPSCVIPNCTLNFDCGFPSLPPLALPTNLSDPCAFTWCGNGTCANADGGKHTCNCNDGAFNVLNMTAMPCFQECYLGSDCNGLGLGPPPPPSSLTPPTGTSTASGSTPTGPTSGRVWIEAAGYLVFMTSLQLII